MRNPSSSPFARRCTRIVLTWKKRSPAKAKPPLTVPDDLQKALKKNRTAAANFEKLSPSHKREYVEWITEAKRPETRAKRIATTIEWITEGKARNWKYM